MRKSVRSGIMTMAMFASAGLCLGAGTGEANAAADRSRTHFELASDASARAVNAVLTPAQKAGIDANASLLFTSDLENGVVYFIDPDSNRAVKTIDLDAAAKGMCDRSGCFVVGAHHSVIEGRDYVEVALSSKVHQYGMIARLPVNSTNKPVWRLKNLDFTGVPSNGACPEASTSSKRPYWGCGVQLPHEVYITAEDPKARWVEMIIAEMSSSRITKVHLDYNNNNSTGKVMWVIDTSVEGWEDTFYMPNYVFMPDGPDGRYLLVTLVSQNSTEAWAGGRIMLWDLGGETPAKLWEYPPDDDQGNSRYLNSVHGGSMFTDVDGQRYLVYGHSLSLGDNWGTGQYGTMGVARVDDIRSEPTYLADLQLPSEYEPFSFPRELELLPDGSWLATEGGCFYWLEGLECHAQNYIVTVPELGSTDLHGSYRQDFSDLNIIDFDTAEVKKEINCGLEILFESDLIPSEQFGTELATAYTSEGMACQAQ